MGPISSDDGDKECIAPIAATITDEGAEALAFDSGGAAGYIYSEPAHNLTPIQSASILKLRSVLGNRISFQEQTGVIRATIRYDDQCGAVLSFYASDGSLCWSVDVLPEHVVPDTPGIAEGKRPAYRSLAVAFSLFLFVLTAFLLMAPVAGGMFIERSAIAFVVAVVGCVTALQVIRGRV
jgi:hypothetical protein